MIEQIVLDWLNRYLTPVKAFMETPENEPVSYVRIEKTGSAEMNGIHTATFAVQAYAGTLLDAAQLNETVKTVMNQLILHPNIGRVQLNTDYHYTDAARRRYRYQAVYDITY